MGIENGQRAPGSNPHGNLPYNETPRVTPRVGPVETALTSPLGRGPTAAELKRPHSSDATWSPSTRPVPERKSSPSISTNAEDYE